MPDILAFDQVSATYGSALVLDGVSFSIEEGECFALLGANGVGKTTCLNTMFGIAQVRSGTITIDGQDLSSRRAHEPAHRGAALVPQGRWIISGLTVEENLLLGQSAEREGTWDLDAVFELFPVLRERRKSDGNNLSGGQQQMLAIGRALMSNPRIILLDEPSEGLAPVIIDQLGDIFVGLREMGTSMLLIEQRLDLVTRIADRFAVLSKGEVVSRGRIAETPMETLRSMVSV